MVYAVCVVFISYHRKKENIMKNVIKKIAVAVIIIAITIVVVEWTIVQLEEGYTPSYPTKLDK